MANPFQGDDVDPFSGARDEEGNIPTTAAAEEAPKKETFGQAFKAARGRGDKTFEFMGKKYTTEMAGGAKSTSAVKSAPAAKSESSTAKSAPTTRQGRRVAQIEEALSNPAGDYKSSGTYGEAAKSSRTLGDLFRGSARHARTGATYKKGGKVKKYASGGSVSSASKRADGCAQRGKTKGKMV
jgi:hypothetical protein